MKIVDDRDIAKDICQETFKKLWDRRKLVRGYGHIVPLLLLISKRYALLHLRSLRNTKKFTTGLSHYLRDNEVEDENLIKVHESQLILIEALLDILPSQQRKAVDMYYFGAWKVRDIAGVLCLTEQTVRNHLARAVRTLRVAFMRNA